MRRITALLILAAFLPACGGPPRIQSSIRGEPQYGVENWVPIPGTDKVAKNKGLLTMGKEQFRFESKKAAPVHVSYEEVSYVSYSLSKKPRWGLGIPLAVICLPCLAFAFIKVKSHWLGIDTGEKQLLIKAHKNNYTQIVTALEARGVAVEQLTDG